MYVNSYSKHAQDSLIKARCWFDDNACSLCCRICTEMQPLCSSGGNALHTNSRDLWLWKRCLYSGQIQLLSLWVNLPVSFTDSNDLHDTKILLTSRIHISFPIIFQNKNVFKLLIKTLSDTKLTLAGTLANWSRCIVIRCIRSRCLFVIDKIMMCIRIKSVLISLFLLVMGFRRCSSMTECLILSSNTAVKAKCCQSDLCNNMVII